MNAKQQSPCLFETKFLMNGAAKRSKQVGAKGRIAYLYFNPTELRDYNKLITTAIPMTSQQAEIQPAPIIHHHYHYMVAPHHDRFEEIIGNSSKYAINDSFARGAASRHDKILSDSISTSSKRSWKESLNPEINRRYEQIRGIVDPLKDVQSALSFYRKRHSAKETQFGSTRNQLSGRVKASSRKPVSVSEWEIKPFNPSHTSLGQSFSAEARENGHKSMLVIPSERRAYEQSYETRLLREQCKYLRTYCLEHYESKHPEFTKHLPDLS